MRAFRLFIIMLATSWKICASEIRNGDDVLLIGEAAKTLDEVEFSGAFQPQEETEAWAIIDAQLTQLEKRLPHAGSFLRSLFFRGRLTWHFVDAQLRDLSDEGPTNVIITQEKIQIAINSGTLVQIYKTVWDKLNSRSRAVVMFHEAMWIANGKRSLKTGESVRRLLAILMDKNLESYSNSNLVESLRLCFESSPHSSEFFQIVMLEHQQRANYERFDPKMIYTMNGDELVVEAKHETTKDWLLTILNPNDRYQSVQYKDGLYIGYQGSIDLPLNQLNLDLCEELTYGERKGWSLPTSKELYQLNNLGFRLSRYFPPPRPPYRFQAEDNELSFVDRFLEAIRFGGQDLYPAKIGANDVIIVTKDGRHLNFADRMRELPKSKDATIFYMCLHRKEI